MSGYSWHDRRPDLKRCGLGLKPLGARIPPHASTAVVAAALKPALRTVKANAKRLGKKR